ncbi:unnamed protein product [Thlaspi arvense]|uniref:NYN domain-containing protein n=1 Tax=Thlaspi arvense TaxID=13288 RepID=A0AAU9RBW4_THLAR|nr:unnamed protein product [Thlaspi arvense]
MDQDPEFAVSLFWDAGNARLLPNQIPFLIANIEDSLRTADKRYYLAKKKVVVANSSLDFISENRAYLLEQGFVIVDAPHRERDCNYTNCKVKVERFDVAKNMILDQVLDQVLEKELSRNVLIISGDSDFSTTLQMLERNKRNTLKAVNEDATPDYIESAQHAWLWDDMATRAAKTIPLNLV